MNNKEIAKVLVDMAKTITGGLQKTAADLTDLESGQQKQVIELVQAKKRVIELKSEVKKAVGALQSEIRALEKKAKLLDGELGPIISGVEEQLVRATDAVLKYDPEKSQRPSYKTAFDTALTKVNSRTRSVLEECLEASRKISSYLDVKITASKDGKKVLSRRKFAGVIKFIKDMFSSMWKWIGNMKAESSKLESAVDDLEKAV